MPATRRSSRISEARNAANLAPISAPQAPATSFPPPAAAPSAEVFDIAAYSDVPSGSSVGRYRVKNPLPLPEGDLYLDLGSYGSGYIKGIEPCVEGGEGYPVSRFRATIHLRAPGTDNGEEIGFMNARVIKTADTGEDFYTMCDDLSAELEGMAALLFDEFGCMNEPYDEWYGDVLYIEEVIIKPRYRGYGIGLLAVRHLIDQIPACEQLIVIISPCPLNPRGFGHERWTDPLAAENRPPEAHDQGVKALGRYYGSIGFTRLTTRKQEQRTSLGIQLWGMWMGNVQPDIRAVVPHLF